MAQVRLASEMKDSGIEWYGTCPVSWSKAPLYFALTEINQKNDPIVTTNILSLTNTEGVIPYSERGNQGNKSKENFEEYKIVYPNTIVANSMNILIGSVGLSAYEGCVSPVYYVYEAKPQFDIRYLNYLFSMEAFQKRLRQFANGIMEIRLRVSSHDILHQNVMMPSFEEQRAIANYLDEWCSKIDEIIAEATASIDEYKELKQAVIFEAVTKGLDKNAPMKDSGVEWIGYIPEHWQRVQLRYLLDKSEYGIKVGPFGSSFTNKTVGDGDYLIYGQANVISRDFSKTKNSVTADVYESLSRYNVVSGDICLSVIGNGTIGWCCTVPENIKPGIMDSHLMKIRLSNEMTNGFFELFYSKHYAGVCHTQMQYQKTGIAMEGLNTRIVKGLWMVVPPLEEQKQIVEKMIPFVSNMDSIISEKEDLIKDLQAYKKSLIYEVVTGKRRVV